MINKFKDRRVKGCIRIKPAQGTSTWVEPDRRATVHDYSNPPDLYEVLVAIEPQPPSHVDLCLTKNGKIMADDFENNLIYSDPPLKPGDVIKGHKVLAVLGVEEREEILVSGEGCEYMGDEKWHFKYLTTGEK